MNNNRETNKSETAVLGRQKITILFLVMLLLISTFFMSISETTSYAGRISDLTQINKAKSYLAQIGTLKPVQGTDTSVQTMAQALVNKVVSGVTVKVTASSNPQVKGSTITYGATASSGTVTFSLTKRYSVATQSMIVAVPANTTVTPVAVSGLSLNKTNAYIETAKTETLLAAVLPSNAANKTVSWSSDNSSATVNDAGVVTGISEGTAKITATTLDGAFKATCTVTVTNPAPPIVTEPEPPVVALPDVVANAYYVSKSGNDLNAGTAASPWKTIQKAANTATAGKTVYIMSGTYNESVTVKNSGTSGNYITFASYPGETVVIDGTGVSIAYFTPLFSVGSQSYIKIQGIKVTNSGGQGIGDGNGSVDNGYITIENCSTYRTQISGVHFYKANNIIVDGVYIDTANLTADQESLSFAGVANFEIKNCTIVNGQKEGIDAKDGCSNGKIYNNIVKDANPAYKYQVSIYVDASDSFCKDIQIYNNTIINCLKGVVVASEGGGSVTNINVYDNNAKGCKIAYEIAGWGATSANPMDGIIINRNTASASTEIGISLGNPYVKNAFVTNNTLTGMSGTIPIYLEAGDLSKITIDGNAIDRIISGQPTGTNYTLIK